MLAKKFGRVTNVTLVVRKIFFCVPANNKTRILYVRTFGGARGEKKMPETVTSFEIKFSSRLS